jgi:hypothetical protein
MPDYCLDTPLDEIEPYRVSLLHFTASCQPNQSITRRIGAQQKEKFSATANLRLHAFI